MELQLGAPAHDHHVSAIKKCAKQMQNFPQSAVEDNVGKLPWHVLHCYLRLLVVCLSACLPAAVWHVTKLQQQHMMKYIAKGQKTFADIQVEASDRSDTF